MRLKAILDFGTLMFCAFLLALIVALISGPEARATVSASAPHADLPPQAVAIPMTFRTLQEVGTIKVMLIDSAGKDVRETTLNIRNGSVIKVEIEADGAVRSTSWRTK